MQAPRLRVHNTVATFPQVRATVRLACRFHNAQSRLIDDWNAIRFMLRVLSDVLQSGASDPVAAIDEPDDALEDFDTSPEHVTELVGPSHGDGKAPGRGF
jgi:hypothetical protein